MKTLLSSIAWYAKLTWMVVLWIIKFISLLLIDLFTMVAAPVLSLFVTKAEESAVTGFPSMLPGTMREFLIPALFWFQTDDAPLDEYWYGDYPSWFKSKFNQAYFDSHWWLRYLMRVLWLWRNPAYGFGTALGYDASGLTIVSSSDHEDQWRSGKNVASSWLFINDKSQLGFCYRAQFYYAAPRCLELYLGYKLPGDTIKGKKLVAMQCTPFRQYAAS